MLEATATTLAAAGIDDRPEAALADSGYWSIDTLTTIPNAPELLIPPARHGRQGKPRKDGKPSASRSDGLRAAMDAKLASEDGKARYAKRREIVEPVFGQIKEQQAPGGSCAVACAPARRSGSCCAAPTTCSSSGGTRSFSGQPARPPPEDHQARSPRLRATAVDQLPRPSPEAPGHPRTGSEMATGPLSNSLSRPQPPPALA